MERLNPAIAQVAPPPIPVRRRLIEEPMILQEADEQDAGEDEIGRLGREELIEFVSFALGVDARPFGKGRKSAQRQPGHCRVGCQKPVQLVRVSAVLNRLLAPMRPSGDLHRVGRERVAMETGRECPDLGGEPRSFCSDCGQGRLCCRLQALGRLFETIKEGVASQRLCQLVAGSRQAVGSDQGLIAVSKSSQEVRHPRDLGPKFGHPLKEGVMGEGGEIENDVRARVAAPVGRSNNQGRWVHHNEPCCIGRDVFRLILEERLTPRRGLASFALILSLQDYPRNFGATDGTGRKHRDVRAAPRPRSVDVHILRRVAQNLNEQVAQRPIHRCFLPFGCRHEAVSCNFKSLLWCMFRQRGNLSLARLPLS